MPIVIGKTITSSPKPKPTKKLDKVKGEIRVGDIIYLPTRRRKFYKSQFNLDNTLSFYNSLECFSVLSIHKREKNVRILASGDYQSRSLDNIKNYTVIGKDELDSIDNLYNAVILPHLYQFFKSRDGNEKCIDPADHHYFEIECRKCGHYRPLMIRDKSAAVALDEAIYQYTNHLCDTCESGRVPSTYVSMGMDMLLGMRLDDAFQMYQGMGNIVLC